MPPFFEVPESRSCQTVGRSATRHPLDDAADFVVASRRLGVDTTADRYRQAGVVFFAWLMNHLIGTRLTDTSNGYRALRATMLSDVAPRLVQDQYQTSEVVITSASHGWRITERPTVWHPRTSGTSKKGGNLFFGLSYARVILTSWARVTLGNRTRH